MASKLRIEYIVEPDAAALARRTAQHFVELSEQAVAKRGVARIAISGGSTPKAAFQLLADPGQPWLKRMPWEKLELYWVDERTVPPDHPESNYRMTREAMLDRVPLKPEQVHRMEGELEPEVAAARYESLLRNNFRLEGAESPRFDLDLAGNGRRRAYGFDFSAYRGHSHDGKTGDGEPGSADGYVAHHADVAGDQPRKFGFLPDWR